MINVFEELIQLNIPQDGYAVLGSGILGAKGIRQIEDIDLVVTEEVFEKLKTTEGWKTEIQTLDDGQQRERVYSGIFEAFTWWLDKKTVQDFKNHPEWTEVINGVMFLSLEELRRVKLIWKREKDLKDTALIDEYLAKL